MLPIEFILRRLLQGTDRRPLCTFTSILPRQFGGRIRKREKSINNSEKMFHFQLQTLYVEGLFVFIE